MTWSWTWFVLFVAAAIGFGTSSMAYRDLAFESQRLVTSSQGHRKASDELLDACQEGIKMRDGVIEALEAKATLLEEQIGLLKAREELRLSRP